MPLYIDDYEAATAHLTMLEDGAYMRLLRLCWRTPKCKLPNDEGWIFRKVRALNDEEKQAVRLVLAEFFTTGKGRVWSKRLLAVFLQKVEAHQNKIEAAEKARAAKQLKSKGNTPSKTETKQPSQQAQPEPEPDPDSYKIDDDDARERDLIFEKIEEKLAGSFGHTGRLTVQKWVVELGLASNEVLQTIDEVMGRKADALPPKRLNYFTESMRALASAKAAPALTPTSPPLHPPLNPPSTRPALDLKARAEAVKARTA